jgi:alkylation response protein AidB-like acyl-CoA dehydrogenase
MGHYKSNVRDLEFNLYEVLDLEKVLATGEFGDLDGDSVRQMLDEAARLAEGPLAEAFAESDRHPPTFDPDTHTVTLPEPFKKSFRAWQQGEWFRIGLTEDIGGVPAPAMLAWAINEFPLGAQPAAFIYLAGPVLADILYHIGNEQQKHWAAMAIDRNWGATMVLTEPDQGRRATRRHVAPRRREALHHQRRLRRSLREHHPHGAGPAGRRRAGHQGTEPVPGAEVHARPRDRRPG